MHKIRQKIRRALTRVLVSLVLICGAQSFAASDQFVMPSNSDTLQLISGELQSVRAMIPQCPPTAICEVTSVATISFVLRGCLDELGPVTVASSIAADGMLDVMVTAFNIANPDSARVRCVAAPRRTIEVPIGLGMISKNQVRVQFARSLVNPK